MAVETSLCCTALEGLRKDAVILKNLWLWSLAWWHTPSPSMWEADTGRSEFETSLVLQMEFQDSQDYIERPVFKNNKTKFKNWQIDPGIGCVLGCLLTISETSPVLCTMR